ncbi:uncharacterized protein LOC129809493 [Phlebotomus papatasi]|uniref:Uncharacterized protein n=1 Tax=Phlebotomus papatasi TaxID=29031 RepID=A0A1B0D512_PHLPP|nr:uncharacterized protein LOC129809493 [Phlebotomus papatasi]
MKLIKRGWFYLVVILVLLSLFTEETEARRKVLRGRRVMTRSYKRGLPIPAWAIIVAVALANLIVGGILYAVMYRFVLSKDVSSQNSYTPARTMEDSYVA